MRDKIIEKKVKDLSSRFKKLRLSKGLSQAKLAQRIDMSDRAIGMIENGQRIPTIATCLKICKALDTSLENILSDL